MLSTSRTILTILKNSLVISVVKYIDHESAYNVSANTRDDDRINEKHMKTVSRWTRKCSSLLSVLPILPTYTTSTDYCWGLLATHSTHSVRRTISFWKTLKCARQLCMWEWKILQTASFSLSSHIFTQNFILRMFFVFLDHALFEFIYISMNVECFSLECCVWQLTMPHKSKQHVISLTINWWHEFDEK